SCIPNYKEFYEDRWFAPAANRRSRTLCLNGIEIPFGEDLLFAASNFPGLTVGVEICEDLWLPVPPSSVQALNGATVLGNLSSTNEVIGKAAYRRELVTNQSARCISVYAYASSGVHESTTDVVFGGHRLIADNGDLVVDSKRFERISALDYVDVDLDKIRVDRMRTNSFGDSTLNLGLNRSYVKIPFLADFPKRPGLLKTQIAAHPFVPKDSNELSERCDEIFSIQVAGLAKRLEKIGNPQITIGVSGGLDSTLALLVACKTMDTLKVSRTNIDGFTLPGFGTTDRTKNNALALMKHLGITVEPVADIRAACLEEMRLMGHKPFGIDLEKLYQKNIGAKSMSANQDALVKNFSALLGEIPPDSQDLTFENVQARMRTSILMNSGFVLGTGDLSELAIGWCTYNGDHMSMYNVNGSIPKTLVKFLVKWVANNQFDGPARDVMLDIVDTEISPELLPVGKDGKIAQKTEGVIGPYELHDFFLYHMLRFGTTPEKILYLASQAKFDQDFDDSTIAMWLKVFINRFFNNQFKRSCLPDGPKIGSISLSPRGDWRMPSDAESTLWQKWVKEKEPQTKNNLSTISEQTATKNQEKVNLVKRRKPGKTLRVLLRIDLQVDFCPGGSLPVPEGDATIPVANALSRLADYDLVIDTQDSHPADHGSFASQHSGTKPFEKISLYGIEQTLWPDHCIEGTSGWEFHRDLDRSMVARTFLKGQDPRVDSYSGVRDNGGNAPQALRKKHEFLGQSTGLIEYLKDQASALGRNEIEIDLIGLALGYCISWTALDLVAEKYKNKALKVKLVRQGVKAIDSDATDQLLTQLEGAGIEIIEFADLVPLDLASSLKSS
ncbi:MAG: NAD(+) synthase, partial [Candidatus Obscuribacterales bacterium]|nr:NAD(+) synthase [Candidatus Obscuribacterales bacterium]